MADSAQQTPHHEDDPVEPAAPGESDGARDDEPGDGAAGEPASHAVVVVGPDGSPLDSVEQAAASDTGDDPRSLVEQPAKVMRIGSMIKQLLEEVRESPLDEAARHRLREIHARSVSELEDGLAPELVDELERLSLPFAEGEAPSEAELRIAQAQLVGWLEGLFHGIQTALFAQQVAARVAFEEMRKQAIGSGPESADPPGDVGGAHLSRDSRISGPYL